MHAHADSVARRTRVAAVALALAGLLLLAAGSALLNAYWLRVLTGIFLLAVVAQGLNLMAGYTGYLAFGNVVFFGVGGYATAILMVRFGLPFAAAATLGVAVCVSGALILGPPLLQLKGHYFAIATLALNEAIKEVAANATAITGGGMGLSLPLPAGGPLANAMRFYWLTLALAALCGWITWEFSRRRLGLGCRAIRDLESRAEAGGLHTMRHKTLAWMLSAAMTGAAGAVQAWWLTYIDAPSMFDLALTVKAFAVLLIGGLGTVLGPVLGAFFIEILGTLTWSHLLNWHLGANGAVIVGLILLFPDGLEAGAGGGFGNRCAALLRCLRPRR